LHNIADGFARDTGSPTPDWLVEAANMAISAAPQSDFPTRFAAMNSRSRAVLPASWNSFCFAYGL
jgi:hypothetical protein